MAKKYTHILIGLLFISLAMACSKEELSDFKEPYGKGKEGLGIKIDPNQSPEPEIGQPGTIVSINAIGLMPHKDKLVFMFNGEEAEIVEVSETGLKVKVPAFASTGVTSVAVDDIIIFGPEFKVTGKIQLDPTFLADAGTNGMIDKVVELPDGKMFFVGNFTNYDNKGIVRPINRIARAFPDGTYDPSFRSGRGSNGFLSSLLPLNNKYIIAGGFSGYDQRRENISNITALNSNGTIDTMGIHTFRRPNQTDTIKYFPKFNGGTDGTIFDLYEQNGKIIASGRFRYYVSRRYDEPNLLETSDTVILDSVEARQIIRLNSDGSLDKTYRFTPEGKTFKGGNGRVLTYMHLEGSELGKMLVYGEFTTFDGNSVGRITRLLPDGTIDGDFKAGTGANDDISSATYNQELEKYVITGTFSSYNGHAVKGLAVLNKDGTVDESFTPKVFDGGYPEFAKMLADGLIVVSGDFRTYDGVARNRFMVLNPNGELAVGYNSTGIFKGYLTNVIETKSADNKRALLLIGNFWRFNNEEVHNVIRLILE